MNSHHTINVGIKFGQSTQAFFSYQTADNLIIFVHGFNGEAIPTWKNFSSMLPNNQDFAMSDIVFYGYDTLNKQAGDHATEFYYFLRNVQQPLRNNILPVNQNLPERNYSKILLVAHSLGSVIVRQSLLLGIEDEWVSKIQMVLFAPAHNGANVIPLLSGVFSGLFKIIPLLARSKYPILNDLDPQNNNSILRAIKERTQQLQDQGQAEFTKAKIVVFAENDKVVQNIPYLGDSPPILISGKSHTEVCKPNEQYIKPLELLKSIIQ